jgi:hypothetical protein
MLTPRQLDNWFTYHQPTEATAPKYAAIRSAEVVVVQAFEAAWTGPCEPKAFSLINDATRMFAEVIDANCPDGEDMNAAIRHVRLARNAANEAMQLLIASGGSGFDKAIEAQALAYLRAARWQANTAIACDGM